MTALQDAAHDRLRAIEANSPISRISHTRTISNWPKVDALPEPSIAHAAPYPFAALGPIMGPAAKAIHRDVQTPDAAAAGSVLAAASLACQPHADIVMPHGQRAPLSLFIATGVPSGERKTAGDAVVQREVEDVRREQARQYLNERAAVGDSKEQAKPPARSLTIGKATTEGLQMILKGQPHVGLFSSEGGELLGGHSMREERRSAGLAWLLKAWGGETLDSLTRGDGLSILLGRRVCMHVMVQPLLLRTLLSDPLAQGQGLLARMLIAQPEALAGTRMFKDCNPADSREVRSFHERQRVLLRQPPQLLNDGDGYELAPRALPMSPAARALWIEFHNEIERAQAVGNELEHARAFASKTAEHAARIAGVIQLVENPDARELCREAMDGGMEAAMFYTTEHARLTGAGATERRTALLRSLVEWLAGMGPIVQHKDVLQRAPRPIRDLKAEGINKLLDELAQRRYIARAGDTWELSPHA